MTTIDKDIQKQDPGSALIQLYEIQYSGASIARFFAGLDDELNPFLITIPLQKLAFYSALEKGYDIDKPRNLAKSVTVE